MKTISGKTIGQNVVELLGTSTEKGITLYNAVRVYDDAEEFYASEDLAEVFSGFEGLKTKIEIMKKFEFVRAYVLEDGSIYRLYIHEGLQILKEVDIYSCLSNQGVCLVTPFEDSFFIDRRKYFQKCETNWNIFRKTNQTIY